MPNSPIWKHIDRLIREAEDTGVIEEQSQKKSKSIHDRAQAIFDETRIREGEDADSIPAVIAALAEEMARSYVGGKIRVSISIKLLEILAAQFDETKWQNAIAEIGKLKLKDVYNPKPPTE